MSRRPHVVILDVTERCNLRCVMCHFSTMDRIRFPPFDVVPDDHGNMHLDVFEKVAARFFPTAYRVALGCAAEPMMHPRFAEILEIAGRYRVPDLWFPTNLLPLTEETARAIERAKVTTVAVSIDGVTKETYEKIRVGATWERLLAKLAMLRSPLRIIFTLMQSNRHELRELPAFASKLGAKELDVRYVSPTDGVDISNETLAGLDLRGELRDVARDAVRRGLKLANYPAFDERPARFLPRIARRLWRIRAGLDRFEQYAIAKRERETGCRHPDWTFVIRPSGAVFPCTYFDSPIGFVGVDDAKLDRIRDGLRCGNPVGACATCGEWRNRFFAASSAS